MWGQSWGQARVITSLFALGLTGMVPSMEHSADIEFTNADDQEPFLERLRPLVHGTPDATLSDEEGEGPRLHIEAGTPEEAQTRANAIIGGVLDGSEFEATTVQARVAGGWK